MGYIKPRVFISSVFEGFESYRDAAAEGVTSADAEPVRVNEDFPSLSGSPRNAVLDAIKSCDAFLLILGNRGGSTAPSGQLVIGEEYDEAVRLGLPVYVFLQETQRDAASQALANRVSDYVRGRFRITFGTPAQLRSAVTEALREVVTIPAGKIDSLIQDTLAKKSEQSDHPTLRLGIASLRDEELVDPIQVLQRNFQDDIIRLGTTNPYPLFGLRKAQQAEVKGQTLVLRQDDVHGSNATPWQSMVNIEPSGLVTVQSSVGSHDESVRSYDLSQSMVVQAKDLVGAARAVFQFANGFFELVDQFLRHRQLQYNIALHGLGFRNIVDSVQSAGRGVSMRMNSDGLVTAYDVPRRLTRETLASPNSEIDRVVQLLRHRASA